MNRKHKAILGEIPRLRRYAHALAGNADSADDLVQSCLERALARLDSWREGTSMQAWLITILRNLYINQLRRAGRKPMEIPIDFKPGGMESSPPGQDEHMAVSNITEALDRIPEEQREVLLLIGLQEFGYKDTAEILEIPIGTVMSRLARGRENLRRVMGEGTGGSGGAHLRRVK